MWTRLDTDCQIDLLKSKSNTTLIVKELPLTSSVHQTKKYQVKLKKNEEKKPA